MRSIDRLRIENFKSLQHVSMRAGLITVLIGPNGSGKSSVVQPLAVLKQSLGSRGVNLSGPLVNLGTFNDVTFQGNPNLFIKFRLEGSRRLPRPLTLGITQEVDYAYEVLFSITGLWTNWADLQSPTMRIEARWQRGQSPTQLVANYGDQAKLNYIADETIGRPFRMGISYPGNLPAEEAQRFQGDADLLGSVIENTLRDIYFVPASRGVDKRTFPLIDAPATDFVSSQGTTKQASDLAGTLAYKRHLEEKISTWSQRITAIGIRSSMVPGREVSIDATNRELTVNIVNEGFGSNQLVLLLTQLAAAPEGSLICMEEPEIHLHPRAQANLADLIAEVADEQGKQILLTTHSEHILFSLLTKVAQGVFAPEDLRVYSVERPDDATTFKELPVDERGRIEGGLAGFFEADMEEFQKYLDALSAKQSP